MARSVRGLVCLAVVASVLFAACASSTASWPAGASPTPTSATGATETGAIETSAAESGAATLPKAPADFVVARKTGVACPSGSDPEDSCIEWTFSWDSDEGASTAFGVYRGYISLVDEDCSPAKATAKLLVWSEPGARSVKFVEPLSVGAGMCFWVAADNVTGESDWVAETTPAAPSAPTAFTADQKGDNVTCPSGVGSGDNCWSWTFSWTSDAGSETWFEIYWSVQPAEGECDATPGDSELLVASDPGARTVDAVYEMAVRSPCYWIKAVNSGGESEYVEAE
jgi:hypothetical protein